MKLILQAIKSLFRSLQTSIQATQKAAADAETKAEEAKAAAEEALASTPDKLPNPHALTFTGAVTGTYDGSAPLTVEIPQGGSGGEKWELIGDVTVDADVNEISITTDLQGNEFVLKKAFVLGFLYPTTEDGGASGIGTKLNFKKSSGAWGTEDARKIGGVAHNSPTERLRFQCVVEEIGGLITTTVFDVSQNVNVASVNLFVSNPRNYLNDYPFDSNNGASAARQAPMNAVKWGSYGKAIGKNSRLIAYGVKA